MAQTNRFYVNGYMQRGPVSISPAPRLHREEEDGKFNYNELIAVISTDESDVEQEECESKIEIPNVDSNAKVTREDEVRQCASIMQPVIQNVSTVNTEVPNRNVQEQSSICPISQNDDRNASDHQPSDRQSDSKLPYEDLLKTVSVLVESVKSLKNNFEKFENARDSKRKNKKRCRKHYSSDGSSGDSSNSSSESNERRRKKRRHRYKSSRSHRRRYTDSSSEYESGREHRKYHRHCYHCCKYDENTRNFNRSHVNSMPESVPPGNQNKILPVKDTPNRRSVSFRRKNELPQDEPSTSYQNGMPAKRRSSIRQTREVKIIESDDFDEMLSEDSMSPSKRARKPILPPQAKVSIKRRNSVAVSGTTTQDIFRPPNTNKNLHFSSRNANTCQICKKPDIRHIVMHYKRCHENSEVYVSRMTKKMIERAENGLDGARKSTKLSGRIKAICYFCEAIKEFAPGYWFDHYRSHTGEYGYKCNVCHLLYANMSRECCKKYASRIFDDDLNDSDFVAFVCEICNYVQIDEASVRKHLRNEHEDAADNEYHEITLLPSLKNINKRSK